MTLREMVAESQTEEIAAQTSGVGESAEAQQLANGTPSAPAAALSGAESAKQTEQASTTAAADAPTEKPAEQAEQKPADEPPAIPHLRAHITELEQKLDSQKPIVEAVTEHFTTVEDMRPFIAVVEAARESDPQTAGHKIGGALYQMLGPQRYAALVDDIADQHADFLKQKLGVGGSINPQAKDDEAVFEDEDDLDQPDPQVAKLLEENKALKQQNAQLNGSLSERAAAEVEAQQTERLVAYEQSLLKPMNDAVVQLGQLPGYEGVPERVRAEVLTKFNGNPQLKEAFVQAGQMAAEGQPAHLYAKAVETLRDAVERLTAEAVNYHKQIVTAKVGPVGEQAKAAAAAAAQAEKIEPPGARANATTATAKPPETPAAPAAPKSLRQTLFNKAEIHQRARELGEAGRF